MKIDSQGYQYTFTTRYDKLVYLFNLVLRNIKLLLFIKLLNSSGFKSEVNVKKSKLDLK